MFYSRSTCGFYDQAIHVDGIPADAVEISADQHAFLLAGQSEGRRIVADTNGRPVLADPLPPTVEQLVAARTADVQSHLDAVAQSRNYDGILSLCSYATSTVARFAAEGRAGAAWRDAVWSTCYEILGAVSGGARPAPTRGELLAELPVIVWP